MGFALQLRDSLRLRESQVRSEFAKGDALGVVLTRYLLAVEATTDTDMLTSILLLDGRQLRHGAAPNLPPAYRAAIDGSEIGPCAGSCGTAAHFGRPVYVRDIATDPLWANYRDLALPHGLRACWSTPIFDHQKAVIGTFAIYHLAPRVPTADELEAIQSITDHVARAIIWSKPANDLVPPYDGPSSPKTVLKLVSDGEEAILQNAFPANPLDRDRRDLNDLLDDVARGFDAIHHEIDRAIKSTVYERGTPDFEHLLRAKTLTKEGAALARGGLPREADGK